MRRVYVLAANFTCFVAKCREHGVNHRAKDVVYLERAEQLLREDVDPEFDTVLVCSTFDPKKTEAMAALYTGLRARGVPLDWPN